MESQLEHDLRQVVVDRVRSDAEALDMIADGLGVPAASVEQLLKRSRWDLGLSMQILDQLKVRLRVVAA